MPLFQVIKYEGDNTTFVWKHPKEDFNTSSQLIVHETQEALFFNNGQALDLFGPGRYTLTTQNIPIIRGVMNLPTGGRSPFHCEIYFINKTQQMAIKWGTDSQVQYMEPTYNFPLQIGASGEMTLSVSDSRKLLVKIVGTERILKQEALVEKFRAILNSKIKPYLASQLGEGKYSIFEIDSHMDELSGELANILTSDFEEYGVKLNHFYVTNIAKPDDDPAYIKFKELHARQYSDVAEAELKQRVSVIEAQTEAKKTVIEAEAIAQKRKTEGYTYAQERTFDVAEKVAENEAVGEISNMGIGLGMMTGVGGTVGSQVGGMVSDAMNGTEVNNQNLSSDDGMQNFKNKIEKLKIMKESGLLSEEEFVQQKNKILESL